MKRIIAAAIIFLISINLYANIRYLNYSEIPDLEKYEAEILFVINHEYYIENWVPEWKYDIDKDELVNRLIRIHGALNAEFENNSNNIDLCLFLGELSHFLYNLDESEYYQRANDFYDKAIKIEPRDFRGYWFKGYHLIQSNKPIEGMNLLLYAENALPAEKMPSHFWSEYCIGANQSQMYYHSLKGYRNFLKTSTENEGSSLKSIIKTLNEKIITPELNGNYEDIWKILFTSEKNDDVNFLSYLYGIRFSIPNEWGLDYSDSKKGQATVYMAPEEYVGYDGENVNATILTIMDTVSIETSLESYIQKFIKDDCTVQEQELNLEYDNYIAYSIKDDSLYKAQGGGKLFIVAVERNFPEQPGVKIELPARFNSDNEGLSYYTMKPILKRFEGKIFYVFFLDACKSIYPEALTDFKKLIEENIVIE